MAMALGIGFRDMPLMKTAGKIANFKIRLVFWILGAGLGLSQAWSSRLDIVNDTISYLDMGDYFFHGHHWAIINGLWNPLYAFLLGLTLAIFKPSPYWEYPAVHLLLFAIFLFTMACFDYFLRQLMQLRSDFGPGMKDSAETDWVWITIGYTVFLWASLGLIGVNQTNPDMLVAGFFYLSCGLLVTISTGRAKWTAFASLGLTLGLGYLTKSVMFPVSFLILVIAWLAEKQKARYVAISAIVFIAIAAPFITALSVRKGKFTYGESGTYNYAVHVNGIPPVHWQGNSKLREMPVHPTHEIFVAPATFEFREPIQGTYAPWYDPSFWYEGVKPHFNIRQQIKVFATQLFYEFETLFYSLNGVLLATVFLALYETGHGWLILKDMSRYWFLIIPCVGTAGLYALVHYEDRYLAPFFVVLLLCLFFSTAFAVDLSKTRLLSGVAVLQFAMFFGLVGLPSLLHVFHIHPLHSGIVERPSYQQVAEKASEMGLRPGDEIASLNYSNLGMAMWARLAQVQIVAEVYYSPRRAETLENNFWDADASTQEKLLQKLSKTGARAAISQDKPSGPEAYRWLEMGETGYYLYWLTPADPVAPRKSANQSLACD